MFDLIEYKNYCPVIVGEGHFGRAYIPEINKTFPFRIGNKEVNLPVIAKEQKRIDNPNTYMGADIIDKKLYISGFDNFMPELLILIYVRKLWYHTVNLPLIFAYGTCSKSKMVDRIVTLRHGLPEPIKIDMTGKMYNMMPLWQMNQKNSTEIIENNISTMKELFDYMYYKKKDGTVQLPNGHTCNVCELFDYLCISYLATHELLTQNNIMPDDMHFGNIFIHWLNDNSYYNDVNIKNLKEIIYKVGKKYYKIKTYGFVIILGDDGGFKIQVKKDVITVGHGNNIQKNYKLIARQLRPEYTNIFFLQFNQRVLTKREYENTIAYKIISTEPYCLEYRSHLGQTISLLDKYKSTPELLSFYDSKYRVDHYIESKNNILIESKKYNIFK